MIHTHTHTYITYCCLLNDVMGQKMMTKRRPLRIVPFLTHSVYVLVMMSQWMAQCIMGFGNGGENTLKAKFNSSGSNVIHGNIHDCKNMFENLIWISNTFVHHKYHVSECWFCDRHCESARTWVPFLMSCLSHIIAWISNDVHCFCGMQFPIHVLNLAKPLLQLGSGTLIKIMWK